LLWRRGVGCGTKRLKSPGGTRGSGGCLLIFREVHGFGRNRGWKAIFVQLSDELSLVSDDEPTEGEAREGGRGRVKRIIVAGPPQSGGGEQSAANLLEVKV
jgi:hypothetical protein